MRNSGLVKFIWSMKNIIYLTILLSILNLSCNSTPPEKVEAQENLLKLTREYNKMTISNGDNEQKIEELKSEFREKVRLIDTMENWTGRLSMKDFDEVEGYSKDTVMMTILIDNWYDSGDQDYFCYVHQEPIPKNGAVYRKFSKLVKGAPVVFSGKPFHVSYHGFTDMAFNVFNIVTMISDIENY